MKRLSLTFVFLGFAMFIAVLTASCTSAPNHSPAERVSTVDFSPADFSDIIEKDWKLTEMRLDGESIGFSRGTLILEGFGEFFTLKFNEELLSGVGAPNRYSAPYSLGEAQNISISLIRSTLMASFWQPEKLKEHEYFVYLQNAYEWRLVNNKLELNSKTESGSEVVLIFSE